VIILLYFDWTGSWTELKELNEKIRQSSEKSGVKCLGLYGPMNVKWNFVWIFESKSYEEFLEMARHTYRHPRMPHHVAEILMPQII
jgi:hypothetical protein